MTQANATKHRCAATSVTSRRRAGLLRKHAAGAEPLREAFYSGYRGILRAGQRAGVRKVWGPKSYPAVQVGKVDWLADASSFYQFVGRDTDSPAAYRQGSMRDHLTL